MSDQPTGEIHSAAPAAEIPKGSAANGSRHVSESSTAATGFGLQRLRGRIRVDDLEKWVTLVVVSMLALLIVVRLGASLLGLQVFAGVDLLTARAPWNAGGVKIATVNPYVGDTIDTFIPAFLEVRDRLGLGDLPWWSTNAGQGAPLLASPSLGLATPLTAWLVLLPTGWALGLVKLLQLVTAFTFMAWWLRRLNIGWPGAALAGLAYCGTGFFVGWSNWVPQTTVAALIPCLFWAVERFVQLRRPIAALPIAAVVAFLLLAGFPAAAAHALSAATAYFLVRLIVERRTDNLLGNIRTLGTAVAAVLLGLALSAFQLLPFLGDISDTDLSYRSNQFFGELSFRSLLSTVLPRAFSPDAYPLSNPIESYAYLGAGTMLLAALGLFLARFSDVRRGVVGFLTVSLVITTAIVWWQGWWTDWLANFPILAQNASGRLRDLIGLFVCALAGIGWQALLRADLNRFVARSRAALTSVLGILGLLALGGLYLHYRTAVPDPSDLAWDVVLGGVTVALLMVVALQWHRRPIAVAAAALAAVVVGTQLIVNTAFYWPTSTPEEFYPENSLIAAAQQHVVHDRTLLLGTLLGSTSNAYGIRTVTGHGFQPSAWRDIIRSIDPKAYTPPGRTPTNPSISVDLNGPSIRGSLLDRLGARWVLSGPSYPVPGDLRGPDRQPALGAGPDRLDAEPGRAVDVPMVSGPIRGIQLATGSAVPSGTPVTLQIQIIDPAGAVVARNSVTRNGLPAGYQTVPVAGENLPADGRPLTARITVSSALSLAAVGTRPSVRLIVPRADGLRLTFTDTHGSLWERLSSLPRIRWAERSRVIGTSPQRLATLADPALPADTVVLNEPDTAAGPSGAGTVTVVADTGDRIVVDVAAQGTGHLVVADPLSDNWSATIDGSPAEIVAADEAFGAVVVPTGAHRIEFRFDSHRLATGLTISAVSVAIVIGLLLFGWLRRRRARAGEPAGPTEPAEPVGRAEPAEPVGPAGIG